MSNIGRVPLARTDVARSFWKSDMAKDAYRGVMVPREMAPVSPFSRNPYALFGLMAGTAALAGCGGGGGNSGGPTNTPPSASSNPLANLRVDANSRIVPIDPSAAYFMDSDGDVLTFNVTGLDETGLTYENGRISGIFTATEAATVTVTAMDGNGGTIARMFMITPVTPVEGAARPTFNEARLSFSENVPGGGSVSIPVGSWFNDPDEDEDNDLTYQAVFSRTDSGLSINSETGEITGTVAGSEDVVAIITVRNGGDGSPSVEHRVRISIGDQGENRAPVVDNTADATVNATVGESIPAVNLAEVFSDPERGPLTYGATLVDGGNIADIGLRIEGGMIVGAPNAMALGDMDITVTATDPGGASSMWTFTLMTAAANRPPMVDETTDAMVRATVGYPIDPIDLNTVFSDPEGGTLTYGATLMGGGNIADIGLRIEGDMIVWTPNTTLGTMNIVVTATDPGGASSTRTFTVSASPNRPPTVTDEAPDSVTLTYESSMDLPIVLGDWFNDANGDTLTYTASYAEAAGGASIADAEIGLTISGGRIEGRFNWDGDVTAMVTADDGKDASVTHIFTIMAIVPALEGTSRDDRDLTDGSRADRTIRGLGGDDMITGGAGNDIIDGGAHFDGDTAVYAGDRDDYVFSTEERYEGSTRFVWIIVRDGRDAPGGGDGPGPDGTDELRDIEFFVFADTAPNEPVGVSDLTAPLTKITGSDVSNELLGDNDAQTILGNGGDDTITGGAGDDTIDGGAGGRDAALYTDEERADYVITPRSRDMNGTLVHDITVRALVPNSEDDHDTDTLIGIEEIRFDDITFLVSGAGTVAGDGQNNILFGVENSDPSLTGGGGDDIIAGFGGGDMISGGAGSDVLHGGRGNDRIHGNTFGVIEPSSSDMDTAAYAGDRDDYDIGTRRIDIGGGVMVSEVTVTTKENADIDEGEDSLRGIELIRFADESVTVSDLPFVRDEAPGMLENVPFGQAIMPIDFSTWFDNADNLTYEVSDGLNNTGLMLATPDGTSIEGSPTMDTVTIVVVGTDSVSGATTTHTLVIMTGDSPPSASSEPPRNLILSPGAEIMDVDMKGAFQDDRGLDGLTFEASANLTDGTGLTFDAGVISGTLEQDAVNVNGISISANDGTYDALSLMFNIRVVAADANLVGTAGEDLIFTRAGDDTVDGGAGNLDIAVYDGMRSDYRIWETPLGAIVVLDTADNGSTNGGDAGEDTLTNVEFFRFGGGGGANTPITGFAFDSPVISVTPAARADPNAARVQEGSMPIDDIDASEWFMGGDSDSLTFELLDHGGSNLTMTSAGVISGTTPSQGTYNIVVEASDVSSADYDDVTHRVALTVSSNDNAPRPKAVNLPTLVLATGTNIATGVDVGVRRVVADDNGVELLVFSTTTLPAGLSMNMAGLISGTLSAPSDSYVVTISVDDETNPPINLDLDIKVLPDGNITGAGLPDLIINRDGEADSIDGGGSDQDVVFYSGNQADHEFFLESRYSGGTSTNRFIVELNNIEDVLRGVEFLRFADTPTGADIEVSGLTTGVDIKVSGLTPPLKRIVGDDTGNVLTGDGDGQWIMGGAGADTITGNGGRDHIDGGGGDDTAVYAGQLDTYIITPYLENEAGTSVRRITVFDDRPNISGDDGEDTLTGIEIIEFAGGAALQVSAPGTTTGGAGNDILFGTAGEDMTLDGGGGNDILAGLGDGDTLSGAAGSDMLHGGEGDDTLYGHSNDNLGPSTDTDTAVYAGMRDDYAITTERVMVGGTMTTRVTVMDNDGADLDEGTDTLLGIEEIRFSDQTLEVSDLPTVTASTSMDSGRGQDVSFGGMVTRIDFSAWFTDNDGNDNNLIYVVQGIGGSTGLTRGTGANIATIEGAPQADTVEITVIATDPDNDASTSHTYTVTRENMKPTAMNLPNFILSTDTDVGMIDIGGLFDDDGGSSALTFTADQSLSDAGLEISSAGVISGMFSGSANVEGIVITATDTGTAPLLGTESFDIQVVPILAPLTGGADDDLLFNRFGNDNIDGGGGDDTVVYKGARGDYRIWRDGNSNIIVLDAAHFNSGNTDNEGRDNLTNVEGLRFVGTPSGTSPDMPISGFDFDLAPISFAANLPMRLERARSDFKNIETAGWFVIGARDPEDAPTYTLNLGASGLTGLNIDPRTGVISGAPDRNGTFMIGVTVSDVDNQTHDDLTHNFTLHMEGPLVSNMAPRNLFLETGTDIGSIDVGGAFTNPNGNDNDLKFSAVVEGSPDDSPLSSIGLEIDRDSGEIEGMFSAAENAIVRVTATDSEGITADAEVDIIRIVGPGYIGGTAESDVIFSRSGDDRILGRGGNDTAVYSGVRSDYRISAQNIGAGTEFTVWDTADDDPDEGTDILIGIEEFRFASGVTFNVRETATDAGDILVNVGGTPAAPFDGGGGNDTIFGLGGNDVIAGGRGNDVIVGGDDSDIAVFAGSRDDYTIELRILAIDGVLIGEELVVADSDSAADGDDGTDTLRQIEHVGFGGVGTDPTAVGALMLNSITGSDIDDTLEGGLGAQTITGGAGDDTIDGGMGDDTAVYTGSRGDYRIWQTGTGVDLRTFVMHRNSADDALGRDMLTNIETLRFGTTDMTFSQIEIGAGFDTPGVTVASDAPERRVYAPEAVIGPLDVTEWFDAAPNATVTYAATVTPANDTVMFETTASATTISGRAPAETGVITVVVTASDVNGETYDDISHTFEISVGYIDGTAGNDDDLVDTSGESQWIRGFAGNDTITGGAGDDTIDGGAGLNDTAVYMDNLNKYRISVNLLPSNITQITVLDNDRDSPAAPGIPDEGEDTLTNIEALRFGTGTAQKIYRLRENGTSGADIIIGEETVDMLNVGPGSDLVFGLGGGDTIRGGPGGDTIHGGAGMDTIHGEGNGDMIFGGEDNDTITGGGGNDVIDGGGGDGDTAVYADDPTKYIFSASLSTSNILEITVRDNDPLQPVGTFPNEGEDILTGVEMLRFGPTDSPITVGVRDSGSASRDLIIGTGTNDTMDGLGEADIIFGLGGDDTIRGGPGGDTINGGAGMDMITGGAGDDIIDGGGDNDTAIFTGALDGFNITARLDTNDVEKLTVDDDDTNSRDEGTDTLTGIENLQFDDITLGVVSEGTGMREILIGTSGNDSGTAFDGKGGADWIFGFGGDDTLEGGNGNDVLDGGPDDDTAVYRSASDNYDIEASIDGGAPVITVRDTRSNGMDGQDTLIGFERLSFDPDVGTGTIYNVSRPSDTGVSGTVIFIGTAADDQLISGAGNDWIFGFEGKDTINGEGDNDTIFGGPDDDFIFGALGNDIIEGGTGDDRINGGGLNMDGSETDTAVYSGAVGDYTIWQTGTGDALRTFVLHKLDGDGADGRDTLTGFEMLRFGSSVMTLDMAVAHDDFDGITTTDMAPTAALGGTVGTAIETLDVSTWFTGDGTLTYSVTGTGNGVEFSSADNMIMGTPTAAGMIKILVTASNVDGMMYDDLTVTLTINVAASARRASRKDEIVSFSLDDDPCHAVTEDDDGSIGALNGDACRVEPDRVDAAASLSDMDDPCGCFL